MGRHLAIIIAFALLFLFPALQEITRYLPDNPLDEKRLLAPIPHWSTSHPNLNRYLTAWQSWFNDRYPGRNLLIRLNTQIDYSIFSYSDRLYIGSNGWLYYRSVLDDQIRSDAEMRESDIDSSVEQFKRLNLWLRSRGASLVIIDNPMKYILYPEHLPVSAPRLPPFSHYRELRTRLQKETGAIWIDSTAILESLKPQRTVFHRTDFHWNDPAAFEVARQTVDQLAELIGEPKMGWHINLEIETKPNSGGEAAFMPLLRPATEQSLFVRQNWHQAPAETSYNVGPFESIRRLYHPSVAVLPAVVVFGDSFFDGMERAGFDEHFATVYRARIYHASLGDVLAQFPPDARFMVVEFIEPSANLFSIPINFPPRSRN